MELKASVWFRSLLFFSKTGRWRMKKVLQKMFDQPFIKGFVRFYQSSESDITSIAVAYYLLISIFPLMLIAANILP